MWEYEVVCEREGVLGWVTEDRTLAWAILGELESAFLACEFDDCAEESAVIKIHSYCLENDVFVRSK